MTVLRTYKPWENNRHTIAALRSILTDSYRKHPKGHPICALTPGERYALRRAIRKIRGR
jgi:hypothetical protein